MPIQAGTFLQGPLMELTFEVMVAREREMRRPTDLDTTKTWTVLPRHVRCDIAPLTDQEYFLQAGTENVATHAIHFYANEDIRVRDRVQFRTSRRLSGPIGTWYEIMQVVAPTETIAYVRAYAKSTDAPKSDEGAINVVETAPIMHERAQMT
jgi:hypothetical protein